MSDPQHIFGPSASILITGASSGIGAALARHVATYGGRLGLMARREDRLREVAKDVERAGGQALPLIGDVTDPRSVTAVHAEIRQAFGPVTLAFLNAGVGGETSIEHFDAADLKTMLEVNVLGVANWLEVLLPAMLAEERPAHIVGISSLAATRGLPKSAAYCASKAAVSALLESLQIDAAGRNLQISVVEPGFVRSEMTAHNTFPMPFIMDGGDAARLICNAVADGAPWIRFPWPLAAAMGVLRHLPAGLYRRVGRSLAGQRAKGSSEA